MEINRIGIVGGGQLGRMLTEAAKPMGFEVIVLDPTDDYPCPAAQAGAEHIIGDLNDMDALQKLVNSVDVTTWEIEHIGAEHLMELEMSGHDIQPSPYDLKVIQDKLEQKLLLRRHHIPVANHYLINTPEDLQAAVNKYGSLVVKTRTGGYDGRGNLPLNIADWQVVLDRFAHLEWDEEEQSFAGRDRLYAEQAVSLQKELAVLVARDRSHGLSAYPVIETIQQDGQCSIAVAPARIDPAIASEASKIALDTVNLLGGAGVFAIEMFLTTNNELLVNEIAPRVHNSGHLTMEANKTSQFEQHVRAISGLPLGKTEMVGRAAMINILGERNGAEDIRGREKVLADPDAYLHVYGKRPTKIARKMGHITVISRSSREDAIIRATKLRKEFSI